jgi:polyhydroxybutyrate depolymerase
LTCRSRRCAWAISRAYFSERNAVGEAQPLIIALHASGSSGSLMARATGLTEIAEAAGYMIVYPNGTGLAIDARTWNSGGCCGYAQMHKVDDVAFLRALVDKLVKDGLADRQRIYLVGVSNGGMMAYRMAAEAPELFKAVGGQRGTGRAARDRQGGHAAAAHPWQRRPLHSLPGWHRQAGSLAVAAPVGGAQHRSLRQGRWRRPRPTVNDIPDTAGDGTTIRQYTYASKTDPQAVVLYEVKGGGHAWPGGVVPIINGGKSSQNLDASRTVISFFNAHGGGSERARTTSCRRAPHRSSRRQPLPTPPQATGGHAPRRGLPQR